MYLGKVSHSTDYFTPLQAGTGYRRHVYGFQVRSFPNAPLRPHAIMKMRACCLAGYRPNGRCIVSSGLTQ